MGTSLVESGNTFENFNTRLLLAIKSQVPCKSLCNNPSICLLELGYLPINNRDVDLVFQVVSAPYKSGSIVLTTNHAFNDRGMIIDVDNTLTTATIDRWMQYREAFVKRGDSYHMKDKDRNGK